jgi:beta-lactam-binding protein with PASTA domain
MGAVGYGGYEADQPTTALRNADPHGAPTSMLPPVNPDDGGYGGYDDRPDRRRQKKSHTSTILLIAAGILVLVGAILIGRSVFSDKDNDTSAVTAPQLVGETLKDAQESVDNLSADLKLKPSQGPCEAQPKGSICSQDPASGTKIAKGDTINVVVSTGAPKVEVPNVNGESADSASKILEGKGFNPVVKEVESDQPEGKVFEQSPKGNSSAEKGSDVTIKIAKQSTINVPDVKTKTYDAAKAQLEDLGFTVARIDKESDQTPDTVISQNPDGNTSAKKGTQVTLTVAKAKAQVPVPAVTGQNVATAKATLAQSGFTNVQFADGSSKDDNAIVTGINPPQGTQVADPGNTPITLTTVGGNGNNGGNNGGGFISGGNG